jgi:hypothetical protein
MGKRQRIVRLLAAALAGGTMLGSACSAIDVRHNLIAGTMDFISGYTTDLLAAIVPPPEDLLAGDPQDE